MNEEIQFKIRVPKALTTLWDERDEIGRKLLKQLVPNLGSVILALVLFWVTSANAAPWNTPTQSTASIPPIVSYQGRLADPSGTPIDNTNPGLGITFSLYDAETGGTPLWTETHANVPVSEGLFSVQLGSVNPLSIDLLNSDRWLGIQIGSDPEMTPREKLTAVPYAMQAGIALTVPDGAIESRHVHLASRSVKSPTGSIPLSADWLDVPDTSLTVTCDTAQTYLVFVIANLDVTNGGAYAQLFVDGVGASGQAVLTDLDGRTHATVSQVHRINLEPGTHSMVLRAKYGASTPDSALIWGGSSVTYMAISQ